MKTSFLEFEQPIAELEARIEQLRFVQDDSAVDISEEISRLDAKSQSLTKDIYAKLSPWQCAMVARHPQRPYTLDYLDLVFTDFQELHGDRNYADDHAIVGGLARFNGQSCMVIGHQKGRDTKEKIHRNFGMPRPEGYRKALRLMRLAEKFGLPIFTFVDTPGAYPGIDAEERGQSEAIGKNLAVMTELKVPIVATVIGEGGSGGALAIAVADVVAMLQYSTYSVISPEGCASILWKSAERLKPWGSRHPDSSRLDLSIASSTNRSEVPIVTIASWHRTSRNPCRNRSSSCLACPPASSSKDASSD
jgi:acetyl-CoA carboxylase carboxyl transferase subunit alpha